MYAFGPCYHRVSQVPNLRSFQSDLPSPRGSSEAPSPLCARPGDGETPLASARSEFFQRGFLHPIILREAALARGPFVEEADAVLSFLSPRQRRTSTRAMGVSRAPRGLVGEADRKRRGLWFLPPF